MKLSTTGLELLKSLEGFRSKAYKDGNGSSIGYGHQIQPKESVLLKKAITQKEAETILQKDVKRFENYVNQSLPGYQGQSEFDALVIRAFNCGSLKSGFREALKQRNMELLFKTWRKYNHANKVVHAGLTARIEKEISLFKGYGSAPSGFGILPIAVFALIALKSLNLI